MYAKFKKTNDSSSKRLDSDVPQLTEIYPKGDGSALESCGLSVFLQEL